MEQAHAISEHLTAAMNVYLAQENLWFSFLLGS